MLTFSSCWKELGGVRVMVVMYPLGGDEGGWRGGIIGEAL